jgi:lipid-binding SYLF domain-containing protein
MARGGRSMRMALVVLTALVATMPARPARAMTASEINRGASAALSRLYAQQPAAKTLGAKARGILIFPEMVKAGFMFGGQIGEGALRKNGKTVAYYSSVAVSYGFQAGIQSFGYALFFMNDAALQQLDNTAGFELGIGPSLVVADSGFGKSITTNTLTADVYAFVFSQRGLMAGAGIQGSKITRIQK